MKIAHVTYTALPSVVAGKEIVVDSLIREQNAAGHHALLVTRLKQWMAFRNSGFDYSALPLPPKYPNDSSDYLGGTGPRWPTALTVAIYQMIYRFDVWHVHGVYPAGWQIIPILQRLGVPVVLTAHGPDVEVIPELKHGYRLYPKHEPRVKEATTKAHQLSAISDSVYTEYLALGADSRRIVSIPNGVDFDRIRVRETDTPAIRKQLGWPQDTPVIITIGRNHPKKGYRHIPEIMRVLKQQLPDFLWVIIGADLDPIMELAREKGVADQLRTYPPIRGDDDGERRYPPNQLVDLLKASDVFAFPSEIETFGLVALEAMSAGTPVVTTDTAGLRDVVQHDQNGLLCPVADTEAMATAISNIINDPALSERLVSTGYTSAAEYDWKSVAAQYLNLYQKLRK